MYCPIFRILARGCNNCSNLSGGDKTYILDFTAVVGGHGLVPTPGAMISILAFLRMDPRNSGTLLV